jgi:hypothetical protein
MNALLSDGNRDLVEFNLDFIVQVCSESCLEPRQEEVY